MYKRERPWRGISELDSVLHRRLIAIGNPHLSPASKQHSSPHSQSRGVPSASFCPHIISRPPATLLEAMSTLKITKITRVRGDLKNLEIREGWNMPRPTIDTDEVLYIPGTEATATLGKPAAFRFDRRDIPIEVTATYTLPFPAAPAAPTPAAAPKYRLVGTQWSLTNRAPIDNGFEIISGPFTPGAPSGASGTTFTASKFVVGSTVRDPGAPFKVDSVFQWYIVRDDTAHTLLGASKGAGGIKSQTYLELYFMFGPTHNLPYYYDSEFFLDLNRLAYLDFAKVAGKTWAEVEGDVLFNVVNKLWKLGDRGKPDMLPLFYDSRVGEGGRPHHLRGHTIVMSTFFTRSIKYVNCFDLAAVLKVALLSLGTKPQGTTGTTFVNVISDVKMSVDTPWGYIKSGPLFGWERTQAHECNSPFWQGPGGTLPKVADMDPRRTKFSCHCYVTFRNAQGKTCAVDACHGVLVGGRVQLATGHLEIDDHRKANIDKGPEPVGTPVATGMCFLSSSIYS
ncbi:hypothetical protein B0T26DRAFT_219225 [Lasiosphaeria miniovina]|uniref:Uncharacterized protein n=1 Tax=Lasiosphaeria miniovina TaxID=1954250 RepID=A0AA40E0G4_9PEZI|nr:uncharacterized protein B0T26DRAFT_219225 [Lasiosphaeria miniovina]KAK0722450.1 hypothetical protein B0T26DRAFT_219225 [Lasiosphaeria miniovina]